MILQKKTKIVATIGPATEDKETLKKLLKAGMNVIRMNFSHGDFTEHQGKVDNGLLASKETGIPVAFLQDLGGPKIRTGEFDTPSGRIKIKKGQEFVLTTKKIKGTSDIVSVNYSKLPKEVEVGHHIMVDDGKKKLIVKSIKGDKIFCKVLVGGELKGRRGLNFPDSNLTISSLTPKDLKDLEFGIKNKVDFIALSFVRDPKDIIRLRNILDKRGSKASIVAKIETPQAVENINEIIELTDVIMVARGDLAIEVPAADVPLIQKRVIERCNRVGRPVITATQMLESMISGPTPTRAEVSDIANAILDGTDAIMLSEETTLGEYPIDAVNVMRNVAESVEKEFQKHNQRDLDDYFENPSVGRSVTSQAVRLADKINAKFIVSLTTSGYGARMISRYKPTQPILAFTPNINTHNKVNISYGSYPVLIKKLKTLNEALLEVKKYLKNEKLVSAGDKLVVITGTPFGKTNQTNTIQVEVV